MVIIVVYSSRTSDVVVVDQGHAVRDRWSQTERLFDVLRGSVVGGWLGWEGVRCGRQFIAQLNHLTEHLFGVFRGPVVR